MYDLIALYSKNIPTGIGSRGAMICAYLKLFELYCLCRPLPRVGFHPAMPTPAALPHGPSHPAASGRTECGARVSRRERGHPVLRCVSSQLELTANLQTLHHMAHKTPLHIVCRDGLQLDDKVHFPRRLYALRRLQPHPGWRRRRRHLRCSSLSICRGAARWKRLSLLVARHLE